MLSFATEFPVNHAHESLAFLQTIRSWILHSPHTQFIASDFMGVETTDNWTARKGNEHIQVLRISSASEDSAATRYVRNDGKLEWTTNIVFSRQHTDSWVSVRVSCESVHPAVKLPPAKKPVVVRTLLNQLGGAPDGVLTVSENPHRLRNIDIDLAARLITGSAGCRLPIVYVSCGFHGNYIVDVDSLAAALAGMAHVVVEPNRPFSLRLKIEVDSENVYGGTIGIYWPDGGGRRSFFIGHEFGDSEEIQRVVSDEIRTALTNRLPLTRCTWPAVQEADSRRIYNALKAAGSQEVDKYSEEFDRELNAKGEQLVDAEKEIARLRAEIRKYESRNPAGAGLTLRTGREQDLYASELMEIILDALKDAATRVPTDSRRQHILTEIVNANTSREEAKRFREALKDLLRDYRAMDAKTRKGLGDMGFLIEEDGKHYKLTFQSDDRYVFALPKSGSDHRGGLNAASDISKLIF